MRTNGEKGEKRIFLVTFSLTRESEQKQRIKMNID